MKKVFIIPAVAFALATACVPAKKFKELEDRYANLEQKNENLNNQLSDYEEQSVARDSEMSELDARLQESNNERKALEEQIKDLEGSLTNLKKSYQALEENSSSALAENSRQNRELLEELEKKQKDLTRERNELAELRNSLKEKSQRIEQLNHVIAVKEAKMNKLQSTLSSALTNFEGKGLTIEQRNGKVYVSMENKLLFASGSWAVGAQGKQAVKQLGYVLAENPEINVLIEGHTDNDSYGGSGALEDNWDLSTKRATAIVHILEENPQIDQERLTAAGRGEYAPIASNASVEGKSKNRRIEVILTPKFDEISKLLNEMDQQEAEAEAAGRDW
ncbi:OmpA/MotB family protein [Mesonia mobilis]|mgnify:CR=1 FL=1|uniref:OmpA/MotB family protein n=2 Tax=Mesonia mobilis TaxID=369791 RepID=UPI0026EBD896|nr:OmpA family protein [Mesonia mobilis]